MFFKLMIPNDNDKTLIKLSILWVHTDVVYVIQFNARNQSLSMVYERLSTLLSVCIVLYTYMYNIYDLYALSYWFIRIVFSIWVEIILYYII